MFTHIDEAIQYIESKRIKRDLETFKEILNRYSIPYQFGKMIHVAGTNGKGSTVNYLRSLLNVHGYRVGTFTSPYLIKHHDRICIDGIPISDERLLGLINRCFEMFEKENLSMFECDVVLMLLYFYEEKLDYMIIETGMGGRFDKTNMISPVLSLITHIGYDHKQFLGETLEEIAYHKAGIIKEGIPCLSVEDKETLREVFNQEAMKKNTFMTYIDKPKPVYPCFIEDEGNVYPLGDVGSYQIENALLALEAYKALGLKIEPEKAKICFEETLWPGRFEKITYQGRDVYIDGAHNEDGIQALIQTLKSRNEDKVMILFSALADKEIIPMLELLKNESYRVCITTFEDERQLDLREFSQMECFTSLKQGLETLMQEEGMIVITGSLHFISYVRKYLKAS